MSQDFDCCSVKNCHRNSGFWRGLVVGLIPHSFCLTFIVFSVIGATGASVLAKKFLLIPHFFTFLVIGSLVFALISAALYLKKCGCFSLVGLKIRWRYLSLLFATTLTVNFLMTMVVFPGIAKIQPAFAQTIASAVETEIVVDIPCPGHSLLIIYELKKDLGVKKVEFTEPNIFIVFFNQAQTSVAEIRSLDIFQSFKIIN